jgi:hypothetical protein
VAPLLQPQDSFVLAGRSEPLPRPVSGNLVDGTITGVFLQYAASGYDGHYVLFRNPQGNLDFRQFLGTCIRDGLPSVLPEE